MDSHDSEAQNSSEGSSSIMAEQRRLLQIGILEKAGQTFKSLIDALREGELSESEVRELSNLIRSAWQLLIQTRPMAIKKCEVRDLLELTDLGEQHGLDIVREWMETLIKKAKELDSDYIASLILSLMGSFRLNRFKLKTDSLKEQTSYFIDIVTNTSSATKSTTLVLTAAYCTITLLATASSQEPGFFKDTEGPLHLLKEECDRLKSAPVPISHQLLAKVISASLGKLEENVKKPSCDTKRLCKTCILCCTVLAGNGRSDPIFVGGWEDDQEEKADIKCLPCCRLKKSDCFTRFADLIAKTADVPVTPIQFSNQMKKTSSVRRMIWSSFSRRERELAEVLVGRYIVFNCSDEGITTAWVRRLVEIGQKYRRNERATKHREVVETIKESLSTILSEAERNPLGCSADLLSMERILQKIEDLSSNNDSLRELLPRAFQDCEYSKLFEEAKKLAGWIPDFEKELARFTTQILSDDSGIASICNCSAEEFVDRKFVIEDKGGKSEVSLQNILSKDSAAGYAVAISGNASDIEPNPGAMVLRSLQNDLLEDVLTVFSLKTERLDETRFDGLSSTTVRTLATVIATELHTDQQMNWDIGYLRRCVIQKLEDPSTLVIFDLSREECRAFVFDLISQSCTTESFKHRTLVVGRSGAIDRLQTLCLTQVRPKPLDREHIENIIRQLSVGAREVYDALIGRGGQPEILRHPVFLAGLRHFCERAAEWNEDLNQLGSLENVLVYFMTEVLVRVYEESRGTAIDRTELYNDLIHLACHLMNQEDETIPVDSVPEVLSLCYEEGLQTATAIGLVVIENESYRFLDPSFTLAFFALQVDKTTFSEGAAQVLAAGGLR